MMENITENRGRMETPEETETVNSGFHRVIMLNGRGLCTLMDTERLVWARILDSS